MKLFSQACLFCLFLCAAAILGTPLPAQEASDSSSTESQAASSESVECFQINPPGRIPVPFSPKTFPKTQGYMGITFSSDGRECYFGVGFRDGKQYREEIRYARFENGGWSQPTPLFPGKSFKQVDPRLSKDGNRLYFISTQPPEGAESGNSAPFDIWYIERQGSGWGEPISLGDPISSPKAHEFYVSLTSKQTIYFGSNRADPRNFDIYSAKLDSNSRYEKPQRLAGGVNTPGYEADVFVAPDESYLVFSSTGRPDGQGRGDLYVSFYQTDGTWSEAVNMGDKINTERSELAPSVTRDGKFLFFGRDGEGLMWVDATVIEDLRTADAAK